MSCSSMLMLEYIGNCREEGEKFNIWQARLNLEMQYGDPPEQAVMKLFQRALSYTDQKKLYMALITLLERANQVSLCNNFFVLVEINWQFLYW